MAKTPAAAIELPPRASASPAPRIPSAAVARDDEGVTATVYPSMVPAPASRKSAPAPAISPRAARSAKSQPIHAVVAAHATAPHDAIADNGGPLPTPALGIGGGTVRQVPRPPSAGDRVRGRPGSSTSVPAPTTAPAEPRLAAGAARATSPSPASAAAPPPVLRSSQPVPPPGSKVHVSDAQPMPSPRPVLAPPPPSHSLCPACRAPIPPSSAFCGGCGATKPHHTPTLPAVQTAPRPDRVGYLALIDDNGGESVHFPLMAGENRIGSGETCQIRFPDDGFLARVHCAIDADQNRIALRPLDQANGVFLRITTPVELHHGEVVRIGQEILRFERMDRLTPEPNADGLHEAVGCAPPRGVWGRLCQIGLGRQVANAYLLGTPDVFLGRERGDILFPRDGFVSGSHAVLSDRNGRSFLKDLGSSNGTFVKVRQDTPMRNGDLFLLGRNLMRVHVGAKA